MAVWRGKFSFVFRQAIPQGLERLDLLGGQGRKEVAFAPRNFPPEIVMSTRAGSLPTFDALLEPNVMMPLADGTRLAIDLYSPAKNGERVAGEFPVVLQRTPYDKCSQASIGRFYAERGYVAAMQDVRGRYASEGEFYAFRNEGPDGYETVEWLAQQPYCNGRVGTLGASYCAAVQSALASLNPPHLAAMIPTFGPSSYYHCSMRQNGALETRFFVYAFTMAATSKEAQADPALKAALDRAHADVWSWVRHPIRKGSSPLARIPSYEQWCLDLLHEVRYNDYWQTPGYGPRPFYDQHADVPTLYVGGWYDTYTRATLENFVELRRRQSTPVHLLMGPWTHGGVGTASAGDATFPLEGALSHYESVRLRWFDQWLKDLPTGVDEDPPVRYFLMGGGEGPQLGGKTIAHGGGWRTARQWPPDGATATPFYLHADGTLSGSAPEDDPEPTRYRYDPADPVPTIGGQLSAIPIPAGGFDQRNDPRFPFTKGTIPLSARPDVVSFVSEPLTEELIVAGPLEAVLYVETDALDTDFTVKLIDAYPPCPNAPEGYALNLADSIGRLRFRNGYETEESVTPGEVCELRFELYPTANRFAVGHRIRVDVSSSNFPRFDANPNTGGPLGRERRWRVAENAVYHGKSRASRLVMWVV